MRLVDGYPLGAIYSACGVCHTSGIPGEQSVDFDFVSDMDTPIGDLYVCHACVSQAARLIGYIDPAAAVSADARIVELEHDIAVLTLQCDALRDVVKAFAVAVTTDPELALQIAMEARGKTWVGYGGYQPAGEVVEAESDVDVGVVTPQ